MNRPDPGLGTSPGQAVIGQAVEGMLAVLPGPVGEAIRLGAIPHWFDLALLSELTGQDLGHNLGDDLGDDQGDDLGHDLTDADPVISSLRRLRFVEEDGRGRFQYWDDVRAYLLAWWRRERPEQYAAANQTALAHFSALAEGVASRERPIYEREVLYHQLIVDESAGLRSLSARFEDACGHYQLDLAEQFVTQASQLREILTEPGRAWVRYFEARLDLLHSRDDTAEATFRDLANQASDPILQALARWSLGKIRVEQQRWSAAIRLYRASLGALQGEQDRIYHARVTLAFGDAYRDLAESSGGIQAHDDTSFGAVSQFLYVVQNLPFLIYEWLVRRIPFLFNWYFGTNYQNWIIAYLLVEAARWYRRAEQQFETLQDTHSLADVRLCLAALEHQLSRWSRAHRRYASLLESAEVTGSLYRTAQVRLAQGRALLDEGDLPQAAQASAEALEIFRRFQDTGAIGNAAVLLGRIYARSGRLAEAVPAYAESVQALAGEDELARTQIVWALEDLARGSSLPEEQRSRIEAVVAQVAERHYITRFPAALLRWFRRLALVIALPLTYCLTFVLGLTFTIAVAAVECAGRGYLGQILGASGTMPIGISPANALILLGLFALPGLLTLWLYHLIYSLAGLAVVQSLGRRLAPIERAQPIHLVLDARGLTWHDGQAGSNRAVAWSDVSRCVSADYYLWRRPIHLISRTLLATHSGPLVVEAVTTGYEHVKRDIARQLRGRRDDVPQHNLDFVIFDGRWTVITVALAVALAILLVSRGYVGVSCRLNQGEAMQFVLAPVVLSSVLMLVLIFPAIVLGRWLSYRRVLRQALESP